MREIFVTDHGPVGFASGAGLKTNLPIALVGPEKSEVYALRACGMRSAFHQVAPVFIMPRRDERPVPEQQAAVGVKIQVGDVACVVAFPLHETHKPKFPVCEVARTAPKTRACIWPVERNLACGRAGGAVVRIKRLAAPVVVGLRGRGC